MGNRVDSRLSWRRKKNENNFTLLMSQAVENSRSLWFMFTRTIRLVSIWCSELEVFEARGRSTHATILMSMKYVHYAVHDRFNKTFKHFHSLSRCNLEFIKIWCTLPISSRHVIFNLLSSWTLVDSCLDINLDLNLISYVHNLVCSFAHRSDMAGLAWHE